MNQISNFSIQTMTSREIANLVGLRHDNVRRTIRTLASRGVITLPQSEKVANDGPGPKKITVYRVGKRDSYVIVAQLSPEFTARLVDRWQELESGLAAMTGRFASIPSPAARAAYETTKTLISDLGEDHPRAVLAMIRAIELAGPDPHRNSLGELYRAVYPLAQTSDDAQLDTLASMIEEFYGDSFAKLWREGTSLVTLFAPILTDRATKQTAPRRT